MEAVLAAVPLLVVLEAAVLLPKEVELQVETSAVDLGRQVSWEAASEVVSWWRLLQQILALSLLLTL